MSTEREKELSRARNRRCYQKHLEERRAYQKRYREEHIEERAEYNRNYFATHREEQKAHAYKYQAKNPEKVSAHLALRYAVRQGRIIKSSTCSLCGTPGRIVGHHEDYNKPLIVVWVCERCHRSI